MRSYVLLVLALAVLHARAATIPGPANAEKKLPVNKDALDDVSFDNNDSEQELIDPAHTVKDIENNLRNSIPVENVPVKVVEEKVIIKTVPPKEDSNDYVPDNDDSTNIKRVEIDLNNPGPPQRQEHDSQNPTFYIHNERAAAFIRQSIAESQNIVDHGIQDMTQKFKKYFANEEELTEVSKNIQSLRKNFDAQVAKLSDSINSYLKPEGAAIDGVTEEKPKDVKDVTSRLKTLEATFNSRVDLLSEGVELLSILKEEDEQNLKISGKADNENVATGSGSAPANPDQSSGTQVPTNQVFGWISALQDAVSNAFSNLSNAFTANQNQTATNSTDQGFTPPNIFQNLNFPNVFQNQPQQGNPPAGVQADEGANDRPNILQQFSASITNWQQTNPVSQWFTSVNDRITTLFQQPAQQTGQQTGQQASQPASQSTGSAATQPAAASSGAAADVPQGTNSVPAASPQPVPEKPAKQTEPVKPVQVGPIQQIVQNSSIVKGITNAVQKIQGLSNPSKPRDTVEENTDSKGHGPGAANGDTGLENQSEPAKVPSEPEMVPVAECEQADQSASADENKTE